MNRENTMIRSLTQLDHFIVRDLFRNTFHRSEDEFFTNIWNGRDKKASIGEWIQGVLVGAAIVKNKKIEYIFVSEYHQGCGIGTRLLQYIFRIHPIIHVNPVDNPPVIRWYEHHGFLLTKEYMTDTGMYRCYVRKS
jgi:GNAT superfamily N-acetyltransferase